MATFYALCSPFCSIILMNFRFNVFMVENFMGVGTGIVHRFADEPFVFCFYTFICICIAHSVHNIAQRSMDKDLCSFGVCWSKVHQAQHYIIIVVHEIWLQDRGRSLLSYSFQHSLFLCVIQFHLQFFCLLFRTIHAKNHWNEWIHIAFKSITTNKIWNVI